MKRFTIPLMVLMGGLAGIALGTDYLGSYKINDLLLVDVTTHQFSTGAALAATGDVHMDVYEANTVTQIIDDNDMANFDTVTGLYASTTRLLAATGFEAGKQYTCVISATVDGVAAITSKTFQILAPVDVQTWLGTAPHTPGEAGTVAVDVIRWNGTDIPGVDTAGYPKVTVKDGTGTGEIDTASGTVITGSLSNGAITAAAIATDAFTSDELATSFIDEIENDTLTNNKQKQTWAWWSQRGGGGDPLTISGTAQNGGTSSTIVLAAGSSSNNNDYIPCTVSLLTGTGSVTNRIGLSYVGSTKVMTIAGTWPGSAPDSTTTYRIDTAPTSYFADEGVAQAGATANTIILASGGVRADNLTGLLVLRSGTGSGTTIYTIRDSYDANDTLVITGAWAGATPDTTTYYAFVPSGNIVADTGTPAPGLSITDIQTALTSQGYTSTLATNLGTTNSRIGDPCSAGDTLVGDLAAIEGMVDSLEARLTATRAGYLDTINDLADGQRLDLLVDGLVSDSDAYDTDAERAAPIWNAATASFGGVGTYGNAVENITGTGTYSVDELYALCLQIRNAQRY